MKTSTESRIIQKFRERVARENRSEDVKVVCRIGGGMPSERREEAFTLQGAGNATLISKDIPGTAIRRKTSAKLQAAETRALLDEIGQGLDSLATRTEARFLPDSSVGVITIEVGGESATFYFLADDTIRQ